MPPIYEDNNNENDFKSTGFDISNLDVSLTRPIQLGAFYIKDIFNNKMIISSKVKNIACLAKESVNLNLDTMKDYAYSITFDNIVVQAMVPFDEDKYLAVASIDKLKEYLPKNIDLDINKDLMGVAFDAFVVNRGNKNGHIIGTDVALSMVENFINKPFNIEHNRKVVVGVCTGYGFSEFGSSKPLSYDDVKNTNEPFNVVLSGYIWKIVNPEFAEEVMSSSDPSSDKYLSVSASWELGFNEFNIAVGSKNLSESKVIEDREEILSMKNQLKVFGGSGVNENGEVLFLNLKGNVLPLGIGFTNTPAAEVSGVMVSRPELENKNQTLASKYEIKENVEGCSGFAVLEDGELEECFDSRQKAEDYVKMESEESMDDDEIESSEIKMNKKSVRQENKDVKKIMEIKTIEDINDDSMKQVAASEVRDFISNKIVELSKEWEQKVEEKEKALGDIQAMHKDLESKYAENLTNLEKMQAELSALQAEIKNKEIEATFQSRMALIDEEFSLNDEDRAIVAEDLQALSSEEDFAKWYKKFSTLAAAKKKSNIEAPVASANTEKQDEVVASVENNKTVEEIISNVEAKEVIPNASSPQEASLIQKINAAFNKNSIKIK